MEAREPRIDARSLGHERVDGEQSAGGGVDVEAGGDDALGGDGGEVSVITRLEEELSGKMAGRGAPEDAGELQTCRDPQTT